MKRVGSNYLFVKPHVDAIFLLTAFELLNLATFWLIFSFDSVTGNLDIDMAIAAILIFILNAFSKLYKQRYKLIIQRFENKTKDMDVYIVIVIFYVLFSISGFYFVHSNL